MKDIDGYEGLYAITSCGKVWSYYSNRFLTPVMSKGYYSVKLSKGGKAKHYCIHRLVALAYIDNPNNYNVINHKNENCLDNNVNNLEWCTIEYNNRYGTKIERTIESNRKSQGNTILCIETNTIYNSYKEASRETGINASCIGMACRGNYKTAGGYHWKILDVKSPKSGPKPVKCIETGQIYKSVSSAAKDMGLNSSNIIKVCNGERKTTGGLHWEYILL